MLGVVYLGLANARRRWEMRKENGGLELEECSGNWSGEWWNSRRMRGRRNNAEVEIDRIRMNSE